jgi:2-methylisocitrate lyase-like PEP mutase family enzyme
MSQGRVLRQLFDAGDMIVAPGAYDCLTAKLVAQAGFDAVYVTGAGVAASLGYPDYGLTTMSEMAEAAGRIARAVHPLPVVADADTGYGNELNVTRTVVEYEARGVAAIHIEDQVFPKRCGTMHDSEVIGRGDYVAKIQAALAARRDPDFVVIARTDARPRHGIAEAIERANQALEAGADMAFVEGPQSRDEVITAADEIGGPCVFNLVHRGRTPDMDLRDIRDAGYQLTIVPGMLPMSVMGVCAQMLQRLRAEGAHPPLPVDVRPREFFEALGSSAWDHIAERYRGEST